MRSSAGESLIQSGEYTPLRSSSSTSPLTRTVVCATLSACLGAVSFGFVLSYPSPVQKDLKDKLHWTDEKVSWFAVSFIRFNLVYTSENIFMNKTIIDLQMFCSFRTFLQ